MHNLYKNTKLKDYKQTPPSGKTKIYKTKQLTPKYIHIRINGNNTKQEDQNNSN
jgi:hypothetical protein